MRFSSASVVSYGMFPTYSERVGAPAPLMVLLTDRGVRAETWMRRPCQKDALVPSMAFSVASGVLNQTNPYLFGPRKRLAVCESPESVGVLCFSCYSSSAT